MFRSPQINIYSQNLSRAMDFYLSLGFVETFRTPKTGDPIHVELQLDGFKLGIATFETAQQDHGLDPGGEGRGIEIVLWTDDTDGVIELLTARGTPLITAPHDWLNGRLRLAWIADPDGNPIQIAQMRR